MSTYWKSEVQLSSEGQSVTHTKKSQQKYFVQFSVFTLKPGTWLNIYISRKATKKDLFRAKKRGSYSRVYDWVRWTRRKKMYWIHCVERTPLVGLHTKVRIPSTLDQYEAAWMGIADPWHSFLSLSKRIHTIFRISSIFGVCYQGNDALIKMTWQWRLLSKANEVTEYSQGRKDKIVGEENFFHALSGKAPLILLWGLRGWEFSW